MTTTALPLRVLYEQDETAWLEIMSALAEEGRFTEMDHPNLSEYLASMAKRDRREVRSCLVALLGQLLKWEHQPSHRSGSDQLAILEQRRELRQMLDSGTLYNHANAVLAHAYADAREIAAAEASLPRETFPVECGWELESLQADEGDARP